MADPSDLRLALRALRDVGLVGIDCETTGLDPHRDALRLVTIATSEWTIVIDVPAIPDWAVTLAPLLVDPKITKVFQNAKFDLAFLSQAGLTVEPVFDTMIASQLLDAGVHTNGVKLDDPSGTTDRGGKPVKVGYHALTAVAYRWLGETLDKTQQVSDWSGPLTDEQLVYAAKDAAILLPLHAALDAALTDEGLSTVAALEFAALPAMVWMEAAGAPLDVTAWTRLRDEAAATLATLDADLAAVLPGINVDSSTQLPKALAALGVTIPNAQEATLRAVVDRHPVVDLLLRRKEVKKRVSTYGDGYLAHVHPATKRIHATYRLIGAASGRMSCSTPNLQNIPRDPAYRRCIRPAPGRVLVKADYSQIELRIAAQISGDASMQEAFRTGEDLHTKTARAVLGREPTKQDRQLAKALNFGLLYGMGAPRLQSYAETDYGVTLTSSEAARFRNQFFRTYPDLRWWHAAQRDGEITTTTLAGRPRHKVKNFTDKLNSPVQGTGADILKLALARLWNDRAAVPSVALVLVVHDEIVLEVDAAEAEAARTWVIGHMTAAGAELLTDVPVEVDAVIVADWSGTPVEHDAAQQGILR